MALVTGSWLVDSLIVIISLLYLLYRYLTSTAGYFKARGIPYLKPTLLLGHLDLFTKSQMDLSLGLYEKFKGERFFGFFQAKVPVFLVKDPELLHRVTVKDFMYFQDRGFHVIEGEELITKNLFHTRGEAWKGLRNKLTPTFTSGKLKLMFDQFLKCGEHLIENIETSSASGEPLEVKKLSIEFSSEVIGSTAFGLSFSKGNQQADEFISRTTTVFVSGICQKIVQLMGLFVPKLLTLLKVRLLTKEGSDYFFNLTKATKEYRKQNNIKRNDYFQLLMSLQDAEESGSNNTTSTVNENNEEDKLIDQMQYVSTSSTQQSNTKLFTDEGLAAQTLVFLLGGSDSVSTTISFVLYHVARDPLIHEQLASEVDSILSKHGWSYEAVREMTFLDQIIQETLRLYPIIPLNFRQCTIPYRIPNSDIVLEKGMKVAIPVAGLHMDPMYYPDPEVFKPERFAGNNHKPNSTYMPFGDGPRICIAMRFALLELKVCVAMVMSHYSITVDKKTEVPIKFDKKSFSPKAEGGLWLNFKKRKLQSM